MRLTLAVALLSVGCSVSPPAIAPTPDPVVRGGQIFATTCAVCHGPAGDGRAGPAPALDASGHAWHHPDVQLGEWVSHGKLGAAGRMPAYADQLGGEGIVAVLAYVRTLWTEDQRRSQASVSRRYEEALRRAQENARATPSPDRR